jgi:ABC-type bacteriocin/lantibiotic exporter with double-glycine peptidase domain
VRTGVARGRAAAPHGLALLLCLVASGCASTLPRNVTGADAARGSGWARVENVAEVRQTSRDGCGAAALAMVLGHWGRLVTQDEIWAASPPPPGQGMRADALREFARGQGLQAFLVQGEVGDLDREVGRDRPVLVGVIKRQGRRTYPHYEVVVGINRERRRILTLDPARGARETTLDRFTAEWAAAGQLTLVVFPATPAPAPVAQQGP